MRDMRTDQEKKRIRDAMRAKRRSLADAAQAEASRRVCAHLLALDAYRSARCVMVYMACRGELDAAPVIADILASGRTLALPLCESPGVMTARRVTSLSQLVTGAYGLAEPKADSEVIDPQSIDLILVPGTAFDLAGGRIGQGGGYYDRFLCGTKAVRAGVCHEFALLECVPSDAHDMKMDCIVTPKGVIKRIRNKQEEAK